jgi:hypothetical protein
MSRPANISAILRGPHIKQLVNDGDGPLVIVEPLRFVPVPDHRALESGEIITQAYLAASRPSAAQEGYAG